MKIDKLFVCMECGYEWEGTGAEWCPFCGTADFAEEVIEDDEENI